MSQMMKSSLLPFIAVFLVLGGFALAMERRMEFTIALSLPGDLELLPEIEAAAAALFSTHPATAELALIDESPRDFQAARRDVACRSSSLISSTTRSLRI